jgi:hypothetical protein
MQSITDVRAGNRIALPMANESMQRLEAKMASSYDIFRKPLGESPIWVAAVQSLDDAKKQLSSLATTCSDDFYLYDLTKGLVVACVQNQPQN